MSSPEAQSPAAPRVLTAIDLGLTRAVYSAIDTMHMLSISRATLYALVKAGDLPLMKIGHKTVFAATDIAALLTTRQQAA